MRNSDLLIACVAVCTVFWSCATDHKPVHATAPVAVTAAKAAAKTDTFNLVGTEWVLEDLAGSAVIDNVRATLSFPEAGKVVGNGSCNHFFGSAEIAGSEIKIGPLGSTRMACPDAVMNQETKYLNALQAAQRYEWQAPYLLIYSNGLDKPLRFTRTDTPAPTAH